MGKRDTKKSKERFLAIYCDVKNGCDISRCAKAAGVGRSTYYRWRDEDEDFKSKCIEAEEQFYDWLEQQLYRSVQDGNVTATIFALCNKAKHRGWRHVQAIPPPPQPPVNIQIEIIDSPNREKRKQVENEAETNGS